VFVLFEGRIRLVVGPCRTAVGVIFESTLGDALGLPEEISLTDLAEIGP